MKQYDRLKKKWVDQKEVTEIPGKRELCKGKKPHDFVLVIPSYYRKKTEYNAEEVKFFYHIEDLCFEFQDEMQKLSDKSEFKSPIGHSYGSKCKHFTCSVCGKQVIDC